MSAQDVLWLIPDAMGNNWWLLCSMFAAPASVGMFLYMVMNEPFSGLLAARLVIVGSLICFALTPLNSGWLPWGALLASIGGLYATFLIATNWCNRADKWQIVRRIFHLWEKESRR